MKSKIKFALCQMKVVDDKEQNILKAKSMVNQSVENNVDFIILPEMFNCPYSNDYFIKYYENEHESYTLDAISKLAKKNNVHILAGSIPEKENNKIYNTSYLFDRNGFIIGKHRKMHLFDIDIQDKITFKESDVLSSGDNVTVCDTEFGKIGIGICYDIRFLELSRIMAEKGALILIYPGAFNMTTGPAHWELLFRTRALDNQVFTIGVAPALNKNSTYHSYGHSIIASPYGEVIKQAGINEELIISEINLNEIKKVREEIPVLKNKRNDLYETRLL